MNCDCCITVISFIIAQYKPADDVSMWNCISIAPCVVILLRAHELRQSGVSWCIAQETWSKFVLSLAKRQNRQRK
jgi:hypothetical protein